jgi:dTDP-4-dehydrorhamnose reductase
MEKKIKLLLIGKNSFVSNLLYYFLKNKIDIKKISLETFNNLNNLYLEKFTHICNCAIKVNYQKKIYSQKNDIDLFIVKKIKFLRVNYIFLSSRKVYYPESNIKENSKLKPVCNYSKNKLISEKKIKKILPKKYLILRLSNLIGKKRIKNKSRKVSNTFIDNYYKLKKNKKIFYENYFKDFLSEKQFAYIFFKVLQNNLKGTYNISLGQKVYISEILYELNKRKTDSNFCEIKSNNKDNFFLNNKKLLKKIKIKILKKDLLNYCYKM